MLIDPVIRDALLLTIVWLLYFGIHSLLATLKIKHWVAENKPDLMPGYRLCYNLIAMALIAIPVWFLLTGNKVMLWQYDGWQVWIMDGIALLAVIGFLISLQYYDGQEFLGLRQLRAQEKRVEDQEKLQISPLHRYVRHPWYTFALMLIWTRPMDSLMLVSALLMTLYFIVGSRLEEKKLKSYYGAVYKKYSNRVPGLIPLPWRYLTKEEAREIIDEYQTDQGC